VNSAEALTLNATKKKEFIGAASQVCFISPRDAIFGHIVACWHRTPDVTGSIPADDGLFLTPFSKCSESRDGYSSSITAAVAVTVAVYRL